jgi:hypothetical protein
MPRKNQYTLQSLKAMPLAARYDAIRECFEDGGCLAADVSLRHDIPTLCIRRTAKKSAPLMKGQYISYGRADRWNFRQPPYDVGDMMLPPSLSATSPDALYRLMHFIRPKKLVSPMDYYKGGIFRFFSPDRRYMCWVGFHKCELELMFFCPKEDLIVPEDPPWPDALKLEPQTQEEADNWYKPDGTWFQFITRPENRALFNAHRAAQDAYREQGIVVPWSSGKMRCKREAGQAWMRLMVTIANTRHNISPGNDFSV